MTDNYGEQHWIAQVRRGDERAFAHLVESYQRAVFNLCYRMLWDAAEAEDAAQETFIRAYTRLASYDTNRKFSTWLLSIASHYCIDRLRQRRPGLLSWDGLAPWHLPSDPRPSPEEAALRHEAQHQVRALLEGLPPDYRVVLVLHYWHELSYEEIAQTLNTTLPAVKSRLFRARQMLAQAATRAETRPTRIHPVLVGSV